MSAVMKGSCVQARVVATTRLSLRARRMPLKVACASDNGSQPSNANSTIFYGGESYSESQWKDAIASGKLVQPTAGPSTSAAVAAIPSFNDVMGFSGTAPELVNGRLAMLGFVAAVGAELSSGEGVLKQWSEEPTGIAITFLLFIAASLVPAFVGKKDDKLGPFTPQAEMINGRAAMIGFASMLAIEAFKHSPLF